MSLKFFATQPEHDSEGTGAWGGKRGHHQGVTVKEHTAHLTCNMLPLSGGKGNAVALFVCAVEKML
jgi:hypothetical protein